MTNTTVTVALIVLVAVFYAMARRVFPDRD
jgi:hypothetical protein